MRAIIYTRTSKDEVKDPRLSNSTQEKICRERAEKEGDIIIKVYSDIARSGSDEKLSKRKEFKKLISEAKELGVERVWFLNLSRLARSLVDQELFIREMKKIEVDIKTVYDSTEKLERQIKGVINEHYIDQLRMDTEQQHRIRLEHQIPVSRPPFGYKLPPLPKHMKKRPTELKKWIINAKEAEVVVNTFKMRKSGLKTPEIALKVGLLEIQVKRMLSNKAYLGIYVYRGQEKGMFHEPIIEKEVFEACQNS